MDLISVRKLLSYGIFKIPNYQRGYSWGETQLEDFIEDLEEVNNVSEHYTGTFTILKQGIEEVGLESYETYDVVDGQQRLITICILMSCIHFKAKQLNREDEDIIGHVVKKGRTILRLNNEDQDFFSSLLLESDLALIKKSEVKNKTQKNIIEARLFFAGRIRKYSESKIKTIYKNLLNKFKVNVFEVEDENRVGLIFETMNDRGLPLSDIDKIKNYLIYSCHRLDNLSLAKEINKDFGSIFKNLIGIKNDSNLIKTESEYLKKCYIIYTGDSRDLNDIHKKVKNDLITKYSQDNPKKLFTSSKIAMDKKQKQIKEFKSFLLKASKEYVRLLNCESDNIEVKDKLIRLSYLEYLDTFLPLLIAVTLNKNFQEHYLVEILTILENFAIRVLGIEGRKSNIGQTNIYEIAYKIMNNQINFIKTKFALRDLLKSNSESQRFRNSITKEEFYEKKSKKLIKYLLWDYELSLKGESNSELLNEVDNYTIEHIASQIPLGGKEKVKNIHLLGNLVLTNQNRRLENKMFKSKKRIYAKSELLSEQNLSELDEWNDKTIVKRSKELYQFINSRWKLN